jgi:hypothetical protein
LCLAASPVSAIFNNEPGGADGFKGEIVDGAERFFDEAATTEEY